ncbi:MAG TPA: multiheme c-type cytochrome [Longimicrobiales bacterium]|nr:multiheme c-type cytochrome [Longimicrobiales bacterium]
MNAHRRPDPARLARRLGAILAALVVMGVAVVSILPEAENLSSFRTVAIVPEQRVGAPIAREAGAFRDLREDLHAVAVGEPSPHVVVPSRRDRRVRRDYEGAPPWIPHPVSQEMDRTQDCAPCHTFGGYNPGIRTYAPRTPHTELVGCLQCHVRRVTDEVWVETEWVAPPWPEYGGERELEGAPPRIPHTLQLRERCLSCHGGSSAAPDIRTTHPDRFNCRQCHMFIEAPGTSFRRQTSGSGR